MSMTATNTPFHKDLAVVGGLAVAVAAGTFLLAGLLTIFSVSSDFNEAAGSAGAAVLADLAGANVIIAIACASGGALALLVAAALYAHGRLRPRA